MGRSKFFICGFAGAGKSHLLATLELSGYQKVDLDHYLWKQHRESSEHNLASVIERVGITEFRDYELRAIRELTGPIILSLGAGTLRPETEQALSETGFCGVWLQTPFEICCQRIQGDASRPVTYKMSERELRELYRERTEFYQRYQIVRNEREMIDFIEKSDNI